MCLPGSYYVILHIPLFSNTNNRYYRKASPAAFFEGIILAFCIRSRKIFITMIQQMITPESKKALVI